VKTKISVEPEEMNGKYQTSPKEKSRKGEAKGQQKLTSEKVQVRVEYEIQEKPEVPAGTEESERDDQNKGSKRFNCPSIERKRK
jgi:hypothetical protein